MIKEGSKVTIHYKLVVDNEVLEDTRSKDPLTFVQGSGQLMQGIDENMIGLKAGETKSFTVEPENAFGQKDPQAVAQLPKEAFDDLDKLEVGSVVQGEQEGEVFQAVITEITDSEIVVDFNHPLAGKAIQFDVEVLTVE